MKWLCDDDDFILAKNFLASNNGIKRTQAGIIKGNRFSRNPSAHQSFFHFDGLVVELRPVIATENKMIDFAKFVESGSCVHSLYKKIIRLTGRCFVAGTQHKRHAMVGQVGRIGIYKSFCTINYPNVGDTQEQYNTDER